MFELLSTTRDALGKVYVSTVQVCAYDGFLLSFLLVSSCLCLHCVSL